MALSATYHSGTNLERTMELIRDEVTRRVAGAGILPALDEEIELIKSLKSGRKGNWLFPRSRLDTCRWFERLASGYPQFALLRNKRAIAELLTRAQSAGRGRLRKDVRRMLLHPELPSITPRRDAAEMLGN